MRADLLDRLLVTLAVRLRAFSVCRIQRGWQLGFSPFEAITIHYVLRGTGSLRVGAGPWQAFAPHSVIIVPARLPHALGEAEEVVGAARAEDHCLLHGDGLVSFMAGDGTPDTLLVCGQISASHDGALGLFELFQSPMIQAFSSDAPLRGTFELMLAEVAAPSLGTQAMTELLMKQCLIVMLRQHLLGGDGASPLLRALQEPKLARAVIAVLEHPGAPYSVDSLASLAGMSRTSFAVRFSEVFGQGPHGFRPKSSPADRRASPHRHRPPRQDHRRQRRLREPQRLQSGVRVHLQSDPLGLPQFRRRGRGRTGTSGEP